MAQSVGSTASAQVTISRSVTSSPASGSVLTAQSLEPASDSVSPSLSVPPLLMLCLSKMNKRLKKLNQTLSKNENASVLNQRHFLLLLFSVEDI